MGAVAVTRWKACPKTTVLEVPPNVKVWIDVADLQNKRNFHGDMDILRFRPVRARHVRLEMSNPAVAWRHCCVFDFHVYAELSKP